MARSEARISVDIWTDPDFRALSRDAQWTFMFLLSQHDLAHDGVLALRIRRWSQCAADTTPGMLAAYLDELERTRFIVVDDDTEELLVRSFIRRDKVYKQPNVLRAAADHLPLVTSERLRYALAVEIERVAMEPMPEGSALIITEMQKALPNPSGNPSPNPSRKGSANPSGNPSGNPSDAPTSRESGAYSQTGLSSVDVEDQIRETAGDEGSGNPSRNPSGNPSTGTPGERGVVTEVEMVSPDPVPRDPRTSNPVPPTAGSSLTLVPATNGVIEQATAQDLVAEWLEHCRSRPPNPVIGQVGKQVKAMLAEGIDHADIRAGLAAWRRKGAHPSVLPSMVNELMNASPTARASPPRPSTTDSRVAAGLALAAELEAQENQP